MNDNVYYFICAILIFIVAIFFTRWIFRIDEIVENQKTTNKYLFKLLNEVESKEDNKEV